MGAKETPKKRAAPKKRRWVADRFELISRLLLNAFHAACCGFEGAGQRLHVGVRCARAEHTSGKLRNRHIVLATKLPQELRL